MNHFTSLHNITNFKQAIKDVIALKKDPFQFKYLGENKTIALLFFNASLRTRLSTEKAARQLGMDVMVLNVNNAWQLEFEDDVVMNTTKSEHIREAAKVISQYANIIAVRAFPELKDREKDEAERVLNGFKAHAKVPIVSLESSTRHPLQGLTDAVTIWETASKTKPKVVLSWAPHPKALPHAVPNSVITAMQLSDFEFSITHPKGYELNPEIVQNTPVIYNQEEALSQADFVYAKNWSSYTNYGKILEGNENWIITKSKLASAKFMHCLPVRRKVVVDGAVLDSNQSLVIQQANNRTYAAQWVLKSLLEHL